MKRSLALLLTLVMSLGLLAGCGSKDTTADESQQDGESGAKQIETLKVAFVPSREPQEIITATEPLKQLLKEANFKGPGAQAAARIAALKAIAELTGIEPPKKIDVNSTGQGGMMMVPLMDAAMWEASAEKMQDELKKAARE